jgi:hypothetical protein
LCFASSGCDSDQVAAVLLAISRAACLALKVFQLLGIAQVVCLALNVFQLLAAG